MPRHADHDARRRQIAEALWRLAANGGLEDVSLRQVGGEAGVSMRLVQYYFGTRQDLLLGALEILNADAEAQTKERISTLGPQLGLRTVVRAVLMELLPLDDERRARSLVYLAYFIRFIRDAELRAAIQGSAPALEELIAGLIAEAQRQGEADPHLHSRREADLLVAATQGLQDQILLRQRSIEEAEQLLDYQLEHIFTAPLARPDR